MPEQIKKNTHSLILDNRSNLTLTGVTDVQGFDEQTINMTTDCGTLVVKGSMLHINKLNLDCGDVAIDGNISSLQYINTSGAKSLRSKLFR